MSEHESANTLSSRTTPTWEVELLISGVAVFAMLQLAGWLNGLLFMLLPRFGDAMREPLQIMYVYTESAAVILAITFALHLLLRARWIALVGINSVFPQGIRWDRLRIGPVQKALDMQRLKSPDHLIDRADNRATVVFAIGVQMATTLLLISVIVGIVFFLTMTGARLLELYPDPRQVFVCCVLGLVLPFALLPLVDRYIGGRFRPGGHPHRFLTWMFRLMSTIGMSQNTAVTALVSSHSGHRRFSIAIVLTMFMVAASVMLGVISQRHPERFGGYSLFPNTNEISAQALDNAHYEDRRDPVRDSTAPYVQGSVVTGPYMRLAVPFVPGRDDLALRTNCPNAVSMKEDARRSRALLECLRQLYPVQIDGKPLPALQFDAGTDSRGNRPILLAMIDIRALSPGRHELAVAHPVDPANKDTDDGWNRIAFWR